MPRLHTVVPNDPAAPGRVRRSLSAFLTATNLAQLTDDVLLLATELVTNAVRHARGPIDVRVHVQDGMLRLEVADATVEHGPQRRRAGAHDDGGRGIELVERLSSRWGWDVIGPTKVVWLELPTRLGRRSPAPEAPGAQVPDDGSDAPGPRP
jgi:anti-sigma regulatory factor (Ser/Thr protein kinase)